jgi:predicted exporter
VTVVTPGVAATGIVVGYLRNTLQLLASGAVAALALLLSLLGDRGLVARIIGAVVAALLVTLALRGALGLGVSLPTIVALQLVGGIGLDYALFFARRQLDEEERARTLRTLTLCNAMTVGSFGLLALCHTPLLRDIGLTVAAGTLAALVFGFLFAGPAPGRERT